MRLDDAAYRTRVVGPGAMLCASVAASRASTCPIGIIALLAPDVGSVFATTSVSHLPPSCLTGVGGAAPFMSPGVARMFFFSNRTGCLGSIAISLIATLVLYLIFRQPDWFCVMPGAAPRRINTSPSAPPGQPSTAYRQRSTRWDDRRRLVVGRSHATPVAEGHGGAAWLRGAGVRASLGPQQEGAPLAERVALAALLGEGWTSGTPFA
ncbi:hypothetical protein Pla175_01630 [Pirellulimonas nuda]|uniref:Uncharacterized protein n=1 Tax=Pirellulimonas nuda TaxID=2528009 RepID=A0A518D5S0_9BACT|nr:hypothetical protein Pla175_01630 [Pirellulimonas nuda]